MAHLEWYQLIFVGLVFVWSGFVRSGLGFGGAVLSLPFLLLVDTNPLTYLPLIGVHLLVFSSITVVGNHLKARRSGQADAVTVDWAYLKRSLAIMIGPKLIGVFGLLVLPAKLMGGIIFSIVTVYSLSYLFNRPFVSKSRALDALFLMLGGYISGTSLIGAPLIIAVYATHVAKHQLRDTLFVLWFILVVIKLGAFIWAGVDLQLIHHLWLLPCAAVGHVIGLRFHQKMLDAPQAQFFRVLGSVLFVTSLIGMIKTFGA